MSFLGDSTAELQSYKVEIVDRNNVRFLAIGTEILLGRSTNLIQ